MSAKDKEQNAESEGTSPPGGARSPATLGGLADDAEEYARIAELQAKLDRAAQGLSDEPVSEPVSEPVAAREAEGVDELAPGRTGDGSPADRAVARIVHEEGGDETDEDDAPVAGHLGATRYVMTGFFLTILAGAYVLGRMIGATWARLAEAPWFQRSATALSQVGEEERTEIGIAIGAVVALAVGIHAYRRADVRQWTDDVASELSKVTWPDKSEVTNSTIIVVVTSAFATFYLALLDRFWGFVTNLVYGS